jgi:hypothetical protein
MRHRRVVCEKTDGAANIVRRRPPRPRRDMPEAMRYSGRKNALTNPPLSQLKLHPLTRRNRLEGPLSSSLGKMPNAPGKDTLDDSTRTIAPTFPSPAKCLLREASQSCHEFISSRSRVRIFCPTNAVLFRFQYGKAITQAAGRSSLRLGRNGRLHRQAPFGDERTVR